MPICRNCNKSFSNRLFINDVIHNVQKRKYCIECSPFGLHRTRPMSEDADRLKKDRTCQICGREYFYDKKRGHLKTKCNSCSANSKRKNIKKKLVEYKGGECQICSYDKCIAALDFHHINPKEKLFSISSAMSYSLKRLKKEVDKCILVCRNCHAELHNGIIIQPEGIEPSSPSYQDGA